jgi:hypothetical protein
MDESDENIIRIKGNNNVVICIEEAIMQLGDKDRGERDDDGIDNDRDEEDKDLDDESDGEGEGEGDGEGDADGGFKIPRPQGRKRGRQVYLGLYYINRQKKQKWTENAQARRERNRKSAQQSRLRKKNFVQSLEDKVINYAFICFRSKIYKQK